MIERGDVLGIIDVQPTFMPGGELPVPGGDEVVPVINWMLQRVPHAFATQDWHPPFHSSFASTWARWGKTPFSEMAFGYGRQILWPDHAVQGTPGAALHPALDQTRLQLVLRKGFRPELDSYSAFFENDRTTPTGLEGWMRTRGFERLFLAGLATDFCVAWTAEDAVRAGFETWVVEDACRGIGLPVGGGRTTMDDARERLTALGVRFITSAVLKPVRQPGARR